MITENTGRISSTGPSLDERSEMDRAMDDLSSSLEGLAGNLDKLASRLLPVLRPSALEEVPMTTEVSDRVPPPLVQAVHNQKYHVFYMDGLVRDLLDRLSI
jgi:hypothetical protein